MGGVGGGIAFICAFGGDCLVMRVVIWTWKCCKRGPERKKLEEGGFMRGGGAPLSSNYHPMRGARGRK